MDNGFGSGFPQPGVFDDDDGWQDYHEWQDDDVDDDQWQENRDNFLDTQNPDDQAVFKVPAGQAVFKVPAGQAVLKVPAPVFKMRKTRVLTPEGITRFAINKKMTAIKIVVLDC